MALNPKILSKRLLQARELLEYSINEVCDKTAIEPNKLLAIESGEQRPSGDEVLILASFYNCDFRAFLDESVQPPIKQTDILFRKYGNSFSPADRRAIQEFLLLCEIETEFEERLRIKKHPFSFTPSGSYYKEQGQRAAETLRLKLKYSTNEVPRDVYEDFRSMGVHIFRRRLSNPEISGLFIEHPVAGHCVLVNYDEDIYRQRFSVAHEVAHSIFDSDQPVMVTYQSTSPKYSHSDLQEIRANSFASHYLMPVSMLEKLTAIDVHSALYWAQQFRVSTAALAKALRDAGLVDDHTAKLIRSVKVPTSEKIDPEAPHNLTSNQQKKRLELLERGLSDHYVGLCFECHYRELISRGRLVEALRIDASELNEIATLYGRTIPHGD